MKNWIQKLKVWIQKLEVKYFPTGVCCKLCLRLLSLDPSTKQDLLSLLKDEKMETALRDRKFKALLECLEKPESKPLEILDKIRAFPNKDSIRSVIVGFIEAYKEKKITFSF